MAARRVCFLFSGPSEIAAEVQMLQIAMAQQDEKTHDALPRLNGAYCPLKRFVWGGNL